MKIHLSVILSMLVLTGCRGDKKITPEVSYDTLTKTESSRQNNHSGKVITGLFVVGKNMLSFRKCDDPEKDFAVADSTHQMKELYKALFLHTPAFPHEYVYVEVKGEINAADPLASSRGFDSVITVKEVLTLQPKNYLNSCIPYDFWALGKEWSLQVSAREGVLVLKDYTTRKVYVFEYFAPKSTGNESLTYASNNYAMQASIKAVIRLQPCEATDSPDPFEYSASVLVNGKRYTGCAVKGMK